MSWTDCFQGFYEYELHSGRLTLDNIFNVINELFMCMLKNILLID